MKISDFLSPKDVLTDIRAANKQQLLEQLCRKAAVNVPVTADDMLAHILKREALGSTGVGNGVAIPHARFEALTKPVGLLARLRQPIDFDAIDSQPVDLVFVILLSTKNESEQLGALATVARKLRASGDLEKCRRTKSAAELYALVTG
jgi:PTS system nitrogen regulatory IIA component